MNFKIKALSVCLIFVLSLGMFVGCGSERVDYLKDDLSKYIHISRADYASFPVNTPLPTVSDSDVERQIMSLLYKHRGKEAVSGGAYIVNEPITVGDVAYVLYRGYTVDENGVETEISNSSNLVDGTLSPVSIGELRYVPGFEEGLIGVVPKDLVKFEKTTEGTVKEGDTIYLSYTALMPDGTSRQVKSERIELSKPWINDRYGEGFSEFFVEKTVGERIRDSITASIDGGSAVYYDMTVDFVTDFEDDCLTIDVRFQDSYADASLRGVEAKFDIYIAYSQIYNAPEYNDAFVTDVLKVKEEELPSTSGTIAERYKEKIKSELLLENKEACKELTEEAMWEHFHSKTEVKSLPKAEVEEVYNEYYNDVNSKYAMYSGYYPTIDAFAAAYFGLDGSTSWLDYIQNQAEYVIKEKLIFYYIVREEGFVPTDSEYEKLYSETVDEYVNYYAAGEYKPKLDACKNEEERKAVLAEIRDSVIKYYGDGFFRETVYYDYAIEKLLAFEEKQIA